LADVAQGAKSAALEQIEPSLRPLIAAEAPLLRLPLLLKAVKAARGQSPLSPAPEISESTRR
jgi:hypothetical protein